ncbi:hypothetical protein [Salinisphaera sp. G21_0]|uniref:hypothetical protein n=1 Tax=Salinisphaera sp. G21_0 TaxID=2821094 RepID=UPI001ADA46F2|nr:hypothetical protein [Salinisphaera sp. G21_0]MBO9480230.1 hypothetical protein [Salinisphaera sp. G21_0]
MTPVTACETAQAASKLKSVTADQGTFNYLTTTVVPVASATIPQLDNSRSGSELLSKYSPSLVESDTIIAATGSPSRVFRNMEELKIQNPKFITCNMVKYFLCADGTLGQANFTECADFIREVTGVCDLNNFYEGEYHQDSGRRFRELYYPDSIHAGQLDDGMFFLKMLRPDYCDQLFQLDAHHQKIEYRGPDDMRVGINTHPYSLYCGKTYEQALAVFELACKGSDIATFIRPLLGFGADAFGTLLEAQKPEDLGLQAEVPERQAEVPDSYLEWMVKADECLI